ncbi:MAG: DUF433 domain-containing protein [Bryobacteraceae bacterium]
MSGIVTETIPLAEGQDRVIRVSGTRVTLDSILDAFAEGATPEEITQKYPSVPLADIYQVIGHYLHHMAEIDAYLDRRRSEAERLRKEIEARWPAEGMRARLLARQAMRR